MYNLPVKNTQVKILIDSTPFHGVFTVKDIIIRDNKEYFLIDVGNMELMFLKSDIELYGTMGR